MGKDWSSNNISYILKLKYQLLKVFYKKLIKIEKNTNLLLLIRL
jgi:hypothetical protein